MKSQSQSYLDQFRKLSNSEKTLSFKTSDKVISEFKITNNYVDLLGLAATGNIHALVTLAVSKYETGKNREDALEELEVAMQAAQSRLDEKEASGELAFAIATILKEPDLKAKYYHIAILAGNSHAFLKLCGTPFLGFRLCKYNIGDYYALFALNLLDENSRQTCIDELKPSFRDWQTYFAKDNCLALFQDFHNNNPEQFKVFFRQHSVAELKHALSDTTRFTEDCFNQYQEELIDNILNYIGQLKEKGRTFDDDIQKAKLFYKNQYHLSYFERIEPKIGSRIKYIETKQIPSLLSDMQSDVNLHIKELMVELIGLLRDKNQDQKPTNIPINGTKLTDFESDLYSHILQASKFLLFTRDIRNDFGNYVNFLDNAENATLVPSFILFLQEISQKCLFTTKGTHLIDSSQVKTIFLKLKALEKTKNILYGDALDEAIMLLASPSAPSLDVAVGPAEIKSDTHNEVISIANTKKYIAAINALHVANEEVLRVCNQPLKPWTNRVFDSPLAMTAMISLGIPGSMGMGLLGLGLSAANPASFGLFLFFATGATSLVLLAGLIYTIGNYKHPVGVAVREEKKSALQALSLFKDKMFKESIAIAAAPTVPTVRPYLQAS